jgi:hypothetical protein
MPDSAMFWGVLILGLPVFIWFFSPDTEEDQKEYKRYKKREEE